MIAQPQHIEKIAGLKEILEKCRVDIEQLISVPVSVNYRIKFHHLPTSELIKIICDTCEVKWHEVQGESRKSHIIIARQLYCYFATQIQKKSLVTVGGMINRDHTTVIHNRDKIITMKANGDELYMIAFNEIERRIDELIVGDLKEIPAAV